MKPRAYDSLKILRGRSPRRSKSKLWVCGGDSKGLCYACVMLHWRRPRKDQRFNHWEGSFVCWLDPKTAAMSGMRLPQDRACYEIEMREVKP